MCLLAYGIMTVQLLPSGSLTRHAEKCRNARMGKLFQPCLVTGFAATRASFGALSDGR